MKALVVSDSHGLEKELHEIIERHREEVDVLIHCGDSELVKHHPILQGIEIVRGNCDYSNDFPEEWTETINGCSLYVTHGHLYNVKTTHVPLTYRGDERGADLVCFGHSHITVAFEENGVVYVNPGSLHSPRNTKEKTYCICERTVDGTKVSFHKQTGEIIERMTKFFSIEKN